MNDLVKLIPRKLLATRVYITLRQRSISTRKSIYDDDDDDDNDDQDNIDDDVDDNHNDDIDDDGDNDANYGNNIYDHDYICRPWSANSTVVMNMTLNSAGLNKSMAAICAAAVDFLCPTCCVASLRAGPGGVIRITCTTCLWCI